jgi:methylmalonyl-CoA/ethylmalonyl-CoA epimerase
LSAPTRGRPSRTPDALARARPARIRFGDLSFFDCAGVRLLLDKAHDAASLKPQGCIYFRCADIVLAVNELTNRGVAFASEPHLIARMDDHDLRMAFFTDPDGHTLALMQEAPKGYAPAIATNK